MNDDTKDAAHTPGRCVGWHVAFCLAVAAVAVVLFLPVFASDAVLFSTDNNIGNEAAARRYLPHGYFSLWSDSPFLGGGGSIPLNWNFLLMYLLPVRWYVNLVHAVDLALASLFLGWFLRRRGCSWLPALLGGLTAFWVGSNFTLVYAGHTAKFAVLFFAALSLFAMEAALRRRSVAWNIIAGGALGMMFVEQQDVALFFALFLGCYAVYACVRDRGWNWKPLAATVATIVSISVLVAFRSLGVGYGVGVKGVVTGGGEDPQAKWEFATQWSWPPEESIDFVAPGYLGWRSGEQEGPYWGRMGRSAGWEKTRQGFQNFKLESQYLGAIPIAFALFALAGAIRQRNLRGESGGEGPIAEAGASAPCAFEPRWRADVLFWSAATILALLLSFGKYFPLYSLFFKLPLVSSIRNPNKFLQVFQLGLGILTAFGLEAALSMHKDRDGKTIRKTC